MFCDFHDKSRPTPIGVLPAGRANTRKTVVRLRPAAKVVTLSGPDGYIYDPDGVATSALEMAQNSERLVWTEEEVDQRLRQIMNNIYTMSVEAAEKYGLGYNLVAGANIAGFQRVADAMMAQGIF